jgi:2-methylcitrate dehydratase PrpD
MDGMDGMDGMNGLTLTQQLATWAVSLDSSELPRDVLEQSKDCLLDHVAVSMHGMGQPWSRFVADQVEEERGVAEASVYGRELKVPIRAAALVNGSAAHAYELDDWHAGSLSHLGACVIPAVLAAAEHYQLSGIRALTAIVAGYEVMARVGMATIPTVIIRGFHPTGTHGPIGAAAGIANLLKFTPDEATAALGIAASCSAGLMEFSQDSLGTMVKRFHAGRAAEAGVIAASLARRGMTAPKSALDGKFGYCNVFSTEPKVSELTRDLGDDYQIRHNNIKPYACCGALHAGIDATEQLVKAHGIRMGDIQEIVFGGNDSHMLRHASAVPNSVMAAQYSQPYAIAVALSGRALDPRMFEESHFQDPALLAVAGLVRMELRAEIVVAYPKQLGGHVKIILKDGQSYGKLVLQAKGTKAAPLGREGIIAKARALCGPIMSEDGMTKLWDLVLSLETLDDVAPLGTVLHRAIRSLNS